MLSLKPIFIVVTVAFIVTTISNIDAKKCTKKPITCPETTMNILINDPKAVNQAQRKTIKDIFKSSIVPKLSCNAEKFIENVLNFAATTDSPSFLDSLYALSLGSTPFLLESDKKPGLCIPAANINASVNWMLTQDAEDSVRTLRQVSANINKLFEIIAVNALRKMGCENNLELTPSPLKCYKQGSIYRIEEALKLFGEFLPCCLHKGVKKLYSSDNYEDKIIAAVFLFALTPDFRDRVKALDMNMLLEPYNMILNNDVPVECCSKRKERFLQLIDNITKKHVLIVEKLIKEKYSVCESSESSESDESYESYES